MTRITVIADDLSGAAETAEQFRLRGHSVRLELGVTGAVDAARVDDSGVVVVDTATRAGGAAAAHALLTSRPLAEDALVVKKTDSLWRGHVGPELAALAGRGFAVVLAGALPALGRTVVGGRPLVDGVALVHTAHWHVEAGRAPATLAELIGLPVRLVGLDAVRAGPAALAEQLAAAVSGGAVAVVDGETDDDLDRVVAAALAAAAVGPAVEDGAAVENSGDRVAEAARRPSGGATGPFLLNGRRLLLAGSAALAAAVAAAVDPAPPAARVAESGVVVGDDPRAASGGDSAPIVLSHAREGGEGAPRPVVVVVGSAAEAAGRHVAALMAGGATLTVVDPDPDRDPDASSDADPSSDPGRRPAETAVNRATEAALRDGLAVLGLPADRVLDPARAAAALADVAATVAVAAGADLVLTGGETARAVLDRLGTAWLVPLAQVEHGAVASRADDGRLVATKPGSFGADDVLVRLVDRLRTLRDADPCAADPQDADPQDADRLDPRPTARDDHPSSHPTDHDPRGTAPADLSNGDPMSDTTRDERPFIAVTMGDGAGVGPEVTVGALLDEAAYRDARPVVVGDAARLRMGAAALGVEVDVVEVDGPADAVFEAGRINVVDPHLLSADLPWGAVSAEAGHAAYEYIRIACELGMAGQVQGICTAPLNKAALHEAGHVFPGHTELLAHFMGVGEVSMMLSTPKIKVIHVTTHIGLIDAIAKIEPGLVERTVRRGWEALRRAGVDDPTIGVCAINPHAGENGLFGHGEEAEKITPAIEVLQADGIRAVGPLPADTAFFLGGRGDYDLIVAMYHDQGHGPVKVLGIEAGVNITVGLPVIRTSVDHGTAFDIAGTGKVAVGSMIEALRQAVEMSPGPHAAADAAEAQAEAGRQATAAGAPA